MNPITGEKVISLDGKKVVLRYTWRAIAEIEANPTEGWVVVAFKAVVRAGLSPVDFWELTPYLTGLAVGGAVSKQTTDAWLSANYSRAKNLPDLDKLLGTAEEKNNNMDDLKNHLLSMRGRK